MRSPTAGARALGSLMVGQDFERLGWEAAVGVLATALAAAIVLARPRRRLPAP